MNEIKVLIEQQAFMPVRMHPTDAGLDLRSPYSRTIFPRDSVVIDTGVHIELPHGTYGRLESRSSLFVKQGLFTTGTIDEGYTGSIAVKLYNLTNEMRRVEKGDRIAQLVICPCLYVEPVKVDSLAETERGEGGFGSTGR